MYTYRKYNKYFFFTDIIDDKLKDKLIKFKNINIIYYNEEEVKKNKINKEKYNQVCHFCKKNRIPIYVTDDFKLSLQSKANGIFISSKNNNIKYKKTNNKILIGLAHNQLEYYFKEKQRCNIIMLSPLFFNKKYSLNKILNLAKFNLITKDWRTDICALGGINPRNINKLNVLNKKVTSVAFVGWLKT